MFIKKKKPKEYLLSVMPRNSVCAEIGVWKGEFSEKIVHVVQPEKFHLIDPWAFQPGFPERRYGGTAVKNQDEMERIYRTVVEKFKEKGNVCIHRGYSDAVSQEFPDGYFDWIYIDGNHYYDFVKKDLQLYYPKVKRGGYITGDDYLWGEKYGFPVKKAVDEFLHQGVAKKVTIKKGQFILRKL